MSMPVLRNRKTTTVHFREAADVVSAKLMETARAHIGNVRAKNIVLVVILRAALALLPAAMSEFPQASVGVLGMKRNEKTLKPYWYYENLPPLKGKTVLLLDPMLATGGSADEAVTKLLERGAKARDIFFVGVIAAPEGYARLGALIPKDNIITGALDEKLDTRGMIVPGLGDFGDRYFGYKGKAIIGCPAPTEHEEWVEAKQRRRKQRNPSHIGRRPEPKHGFTRKVRGEAQRYADWLGEEDME